MNTGAIETWENPNPDPPANAVRRLVEVTFVTATSPGKKLSDDEVLSLIKGILGARRDHWPKWLLAIDIDGIYDEDENDEDEGGR